MTGPTFPAGIGRAGNPLHAVYSIHVAARTGVTRPTWKLSASRQLYSVTVTGVPTEAFSKNGLAMPLGRRMQPCDAAKGGT